MKRIAIPLCCLALLTSTAEASRVIELCDVAGVRPNQLIGYGLVVGLNNTGDTGQARFTLQSTAAMLRRLGATVDPAMIQTRNAAAVMVTATLPPASNPGMRIDVNVSSLGNARSLAGGTLLQTPLYAGDRQVYAVAQGPLLIGGYGATGMSGTAISRNHLTAGRVPEGAIVERRVPGGGLPAEGPIVFTLRDPSFITARRIAAAIEQRLGAGSAHATDSGTVQVEVPAQFAQDRVGLVADIQALEVEPDSRARIVIDERTGTIALGANVRIRQAAVAQGGLTVAIQEQQGVSQPMPLGQGDTAVVQQSAVSTAADPGYVRMVGPSATLDQVVAALNALGATPRDLIAVFQALRSAGALDAEIEIQ